MIHTILESDIPGTHILAYTEACLVRDGEQQGRPAIWLAKQLAPLFAPYAEAKVSETRTLLIKVADPDDEATKARVLNAITEARRKRA